MLRKINIIEYKLNNIEKILDKVNFNVIIINNGGSLMKIETPKKCPACSADMHIRLLRCSECSTEVQGDFEQSRFAQLTKDSLEFMAVFICCRGSLKDVGFLLDISYPTARNRLDALICELGFEEPEEAENKRLKILGQLKDGVITVEQALIKLKGGSINE